MFCNIRRIIILFRVKNIADYGFVLNINADLYQNVCYERTTIITTITILKTITFTKTVTMG